MSVVPTTSAVVTTEPSAYLQKQGPKPNWKKGSRFSKAAIERVLEEELASGGEIWVCHCCWAKNVYPAPPPVEDPNVFVDTGPKIKSRFAIAAEAHQATSSSSSSSSTRKAGGLRLENGGGGSNGGDGGSGSNGSRRGSEDSRNDKRQGDNDKNKKEDNNNNNDDEDSMRLINAPTLYGADGVTVLQTCRVCGRPESYANANEHSQFTFPLHGQQALIFRPQQVATVLKDVYEADDDFYSPLHYACLQGNVGIARELIRMESELDAVTLSGHTPLHLAVHAGCYDIARMLVEAGANLNIPTKNELLTPLHMAVMRDRKTLSLFLIRRGADIDAKTVMERTCLHLAAQLPSDRVDLGAMLLREGATDELLDYHGYTPRQVR